MNTRQAVESAMSLVEEVREILIRLKGDLAEVKGDTGVGACIETVNQAHGLTGGLIEVLESHGQS